MIVLLLVLLVLLSAALLGFFIQSRERDCRTNKKLDEILKAVKAGPAGGSVVTQEQLDADVAKARSTADKATAAKEKLDQVQRDLEK